MATITNQPDPLAFLSSAYTDLNTGIEVVKGNDYMLLNGLRYLMHIPHKIIYWNSNYASGNVSSEAINKTVQFLNDNQLQDVAVEVNDYSPIWYMSRVFTNHKTSIFSKILFGPATTLAYALGLYKIFGVDNYDVMSNSVHLRSNDVDIGLLSAGAAKDYNLGEYPVLYHYSPSLLSLLLFPLAPLVFTLRSLQMDDTAHTYAKSWAKQVTGEEAARTYRVITPLTYMPYAMTGAAVVAGFASLALSASGIAYCLLNARSQYQLESCISDSLSFNFVAVPILSTVAAILLVHYTACSTASSIKAAAFNKKIEEQLFKKAK